MEELGVVYQKMQSEPVQDFLREQQQGKLFVEVNGAILSRPKAIGEGMLLFSVSKSFEHQEHALHVEDLDFRLAHAYEQLIHDKGFALGRPITVCGELMFREAFGDPRIEPHTLTTDTTLEFRTHYTPTHVAPISRYVHKV